MWHMEPDQSNTERKTELDREYKEVRIDTLKDLPCLNGGMLLTPV